MCVHMWVYVHVWVYVHICVCMYVCTSVCMSVHIYIYECTCRNMQKSEQKVRWFSFSLCLIALRAGLTELREDWARELQGSTFLSLTPMLELQVHAATLGFLWSCRGVER